MPDDANNRHMRAAIFLCCVTGSLLLRLVSAEPSPTPSSSPTPPQDQPEAPLVNPYTAPAVEDVFQQLEDLKPVPFDLLKRDFPQPNRASREQMGLIFGGLIAEGFLIVECERKALIEDLGRVLLRQARSLGVADRVMRHSASLTDLGKQGDWPAMHRELKATQQDVEQAMTELNDQKMAHLISLGGWLRGLEITAGAVEANYTADRARGLWQRDIIHYYDEELRALPPAIAQTPLFENLRTGVEAIRDVLDKAPPDDISLPVVKTLRAQAHNLNVAIAQAP